MAVFDAASYDQHEMVAFHEDRQSGLRAIIALHNCQLGPAVGGLRMYPYTDDSAALDDVLRLSRGMTYKSALAGLPMGGGKAVIIGDPRRDKTPALMRAMGAFIDTFAGRFITAEDSGTTVADMREIARRTAYVSGTDEQGGGDPSPYTAHGVYCGILAALRQCRGSDRLDGVSVALQGAGAVGRHLAKRLLDAGAKVFVADVNRENLDRAVELGAEAVSPASILSLEVDVLAPCAMGAVLDEQTVEVVRAGIVAGSANNQLATPAQARRLFERGILYVPDFVLNAGGIIAVHYQRSAAQGQQDGCVEQRSLEHIERIAGVLSDIFARAQAQQCDTHSIAEAMAEEKFRPTSAAPSRRAS